MNKEVYQWKGMQYIVRYPNDYVKGERYPVIVFLHGSGSRGSNIEKVQGNPYFRITDPFTDFPFITVAPQCSENTWFDMFERLEELVKKVVQEPYADPQRIYLMGASMGGYAVWQLAMSMPEYFAAIVPICGGGMYWNAGRLKTVPVWAFHGEKDNTVFVEESVKMVDGVNRRGGNARLTIYPENAHDAWSDTYGDSNVFDWLLSCKRHDGNDSADPYNDSSVYG